MKAFDDIGRVHDPANLLVVLKIAAQTRPVLFPGFYHLRIPGAPVGRQLIQVAFCQLLGGGAIDALKVFHKGFDVLMGKIFVGVANLMDDAELHFRLWENTFNGLGEALKVIDTGYENVTYSPIM